MSDFHPTEEEDIEFVNEYDRKIQSFEWRVDADNASKAFLDEYLSPLYTAGTELQKAMEKYRAAYRNYQLEPSEYEHLGGHAYHARLCIEDALDRGIIIQGDGLTGKLEECRMKITELEGKRTNLENQLIIVSRKNQALEKEKNSYKKLKIAEEKKQ